MHNVVRSSLLVIGVIIQMILPSVIAMDPYSHQEANIKWCTRAVEQDLDTDRNFTMDDENMILLSKQGAGLNAVIEAFTYAKETETWSCPAELSLTRMHTHGYRMAVDPKGNAVVAWQLVEEGYDKVQASIYDKSTNSWSPIVTLSGMLKNISITHVAMSAAGNVLICWRKEGPTSDVFNTVDYSQSLKKWSKTQSRIVSKEFLNQSL